MTTQALITRIKALRELAEKEIRGGLDCGTHDNSEMIELYDAVLKVLEGR